MSQVFVTGSFDNLRSRHVRFLEAAAKLGEVNVLLWSDETTRTVEGSTPLFKVDERLYLLWSIRYVSRISVVSGQLEDDALTFSQDERRYMVQAVRFVKQALVSSGQGWLDAEPEIERVKSDIYAVNEDGDKPEKQQYCAHHGIQYVVLKRIPRDGLPRRESTQLREF
jgi:glycerol-3-phosphate cytidylyltransferase-like family protein